MRSRAGLILALALVRLQVPSLAAAQLPPGCSEVCGVSCVKPIAIPDRWDDVTAIPGYDGTLKRPNWRNDGKFDQENFSDTNGNGLYDPGEPFVDGNGNGKFDAEAYNPLTTGYVAGPTAGNALAPGGDFGRSFTLAYDNGNAAPVAGAYQPIDFPPINKGAPIAGSAPLAANWQGCNPGVIEPADRLQTEAGAQTAPTNQAMHDLVAQDPNAYWDPLTQTVQGSAFAESPRVIRIALYDPRTFPSPGRTYVVASKVLPFFMEFITGNAQVQGRFLRESTAGTACGGGSSGGWFYSCATAAPTTSWGRVKATYR